MAARRSKPPRFRAREADPRLAAEVSRLRAENEALRRQQAYSDLSDGASSRTSVSRSYDAELADLRGSNERLLASQRSLERTVRELRDTATPSPRRSDGAWPPRSPPPDPWPAASPASPPASPAAPAAPWDRAPPASPQAGAWAAASTEAEADPLLARVPRLIREGGYLWKVPGHHAATAARRRWFQVKRFRQFDVALTWCDLRALRRAQQHAGGGFAPPAPRVREFLLSDVGELRPGHQTPAWWSQAAARAALPVEDLCWSLVARDGRTLDLAAETVQEARLWKEALGAVLRALDTATQAPAPPARQVAAVLPLEARRLVRAARGGDAPALTDALRTVTDVDACIDETTGDTALLLSCRRGFAECARACLAHGARNDPHPTWGGTALQLAVAHQQTPAARELLRAAAASGADRAVANHVVVSEDKGGADLRRGDAPLHTAARHCDAATVQLLLEHHADPLARDAGGRTAAHVAVAAGRDRGLDALALLLDAGFAAAVDARDASDRGETVLHVACRGGAKRCAALLLRSAADARARDGDGATPRDVALRAGFADVADLVIGYADAVRAPPPPRAAAPLVDERRLGRGATVVAAAEASPRRGYASDSSRGSRDGDWPAAMTASPPPPPPPSPPGTFLCAGAQWQELWSDADQYAYFQHVATGHTQWDDPRRGRPPPPPAPPPALPPPPPQRASRSRSAPEVLGNARRRPARDASPGRRAFATGGPLATAVDVVAVARLAATDPPAPRAAPAASWDAALAAPPPAPRTAPALSWDEAVAVAPPPATRGAVAASWDSVSTLRASPAPDWDERSASTARSDAVAAPPWGPEPPSMRSAASARTFESSAASDGDFDDVDIATDDGGGDPDDEVDEFFEELVAPAAFGAAPEERVFGAPPLDAAAAFDAPPTDAAAASSPPEDQPAELQTQFTFAPAEEQPVAAAFVASSPAPTALPADDVATAADAPAPPAADDDAPAADVAAADAATDVAAADAATDVAAAAAATDVTAADAATDAVSGAAADAQRLIAAASAHVLRTESPTKLRAGRPPRPESPAVAARAVQARARSPGTDEAYPKYSVSRDTWDL